MPNRMRSIQEVTVVWWRVCVGCGWVGGGSVGRDNVVSWITPNGGSIMVFFAIVSSSFEKNSERTFISGVQAYVSI